MTAESAVRYKQQLRLEPCRAITVDMASATSGSPSRPRTVLWASIFSDSPVCSHWVRVAVANKAPEKSAIATKDLGEEQRIEEPRRPKSSCFEAWMFHAPRQLIDSDSLSPQIVTN